jgi:PAS domain S-box-containing protein
MAPTRLSLASSTKVAAPAALALLLAPTQAAGQAAPWAYTISDGLILLAVVMAIILPIVVVTLLRERRLREVEELRARLDRRERVLEMVVDTVSSGIVAFDAHGQIETMNEAARRMLGVESASTHPVAWPEIARFRPTEQGAQGVAPVWAVLMGKRIRGADYTLEIEGGGEPRRVRVNAEPAPLGGPIGAVMTIEDVTEQHHARVLADRAERLDALGKLTGGVAHDFNNLLSTIMGAVQLAERRAGDDPRIARHLAVALRATRTGADLVERLLGFAKRGSGEMETVPAGALLDDARSLASNMIGPNVAIVFEPCEDGVAMRCDRAQIVTAMLNLIANARDAIDASGRAGTITVGAIDSRDEPGMAEIVVADTGTGMSDEVRARALDPFFTTKGAARGTGLGLSMVYGALRRCGGDMRIHSVLEKGTTVRLLLPKVAMTRAPSPGDDAVGLQTSGGAGRAVLLVEDEADLLDTAEAMLGDLGYAVIRASDGASALRELDTGRVVDVLLTDLMMPGGIDGVALARAARTRRPGLPVVLASGLIETEPTALGLDGVKRLSKPYAIETLATALRVALSEAPSQRVATETPRARAGGATR